MDHTETKNPSLTFHWQWFRRPLVGCMFMVASLMVPLRAVDCLRVVTLGDSHSTVEGGFAQSLASATGERVEHIHVGVVGASVWDLLRDIRVQHRYKLEAMSTWRPGLILVAFGTNEAKSWTEDQSDSYSMAWDQVLRQLKVIFAEARIIILGPPDANFRGLRHVRAIQKATAAKWEVGWLDRVEVMGGDGAMALWRAARGGRYAGKDGVHLTVDGYTELARRVANVVARDIFQGIATQD